MKNAVFVLLTLALTACGGGGGKSQSASAPPAAPSSSSSSSSAASSGGTTVPARYSLEIERSEYTVSESSTFSVALAESISTGVARSVLSTSAFVSAAYNPATGAVDVSAAPVDRLTRAIITVTGTHGAVADSASFTVIVENTSGADLVLEASSLMMAADNVALLSEESAAIAFLAGLASAAGIGIEAESPVAPLALTLAAKKDALGAALHSHLDGHASETDLADALGQFRQALGATTGQALSHINLLLDLVGVPAIASVGGAHYVDQSASISQLIGNESIGTWTMGVWSFTGAHAFLNDVLPSLGLSCAK